MDSPAARRVFALPELLHLIMACLADDYPSLFSAALVCREWSTAAIIRLWREPPVQALLFVHRDRRQSFASIIRRLYIGGRRTNCHALLADLSFTALRKLDLNFGRTSPQAYPVAQYLHPALVELAVAGLHVPAHLLRLLREQCPRLRVLHVSGSISNVAEGRLVSLLEQRPTLTKVRLSYGTGSISDAFFSLASHPNILELELVGAVHASAMKKVSDSITHPFPNLERFDICTQSRTVSAILAAIGRPYKLCIDLMDGHDVNTFQQLSSLVDLKDLTLLTRTGRFFPQILPRLHTLSALRKISISLRSDVLSDKLDEEIWEALAKNVPLLEIFIFEGAELGTASPLVPLGKHCRRLDTVATDTKCVIGDWARIEQPLFPCLLSLAVDMFDCAILPEDDDSTGDSLYEQDLSDAFRMAAAAASILRRHAPRLVSVVVATGDVVDDFNGFVCDSMLQHWTIWH